jgi:hypothetical protein
MDRDTVEAFVNRVEDMKDIRDLELGIAENGQKPLIAWDQAKVLLGLGD